MAVRYSTGLRNGMLGSAGFKELFTNGVLRIYSGSQPASANDAVSGTLLLEVTVGGGAFSHGTATNGLNFEDPVGGAVSKAIAEEWRGSGIATGTAGWARLCGNPLDDGSSSTTLARLDMSVAKTGGDLTLSNTSIVTGVPTTIDVFTLTFPVQ